MKSGPDVERVAGLSGHDYVIDDHGVVSVVRGVTTDHSKALLWPAYHTASCASHNLTTPRKLHITRDGKQIHSDNLMSFFDNCHLAPIATLRLIRPWNRFPYPDHCPPLPPVIRNFTDAIMSYGGKLYLYGSRALNFHHPESDWDFILDHDGDPRALLDLASSVTGLCTPLSSTALRARAAEYGPYSLVSPADLMTIMRRSLTYLMVGNYQLDLIPRPRMPQERIPDVFRPYRDRRLVGEVLSGSGESFAMPRVIRLRRERGGYVEIRHVSWLLSGVERLAGHAVAFSRLFMSPSDDLWFHARYSGFSILD